MTFRMKFLYIMGNVAEWIIDNIIAIILGIVLLAVGLRKDYGAEFFIASAAVDLGLFILFAVIRKVKNKEYK